MISVTKQEVVKLEDVLHLYQAVGQTIYINPKCWRSPCLTH